MKGIIWRLLMALALVFEFALAGCAPSFPPAPPINWITLHWTAGPYDWVAGNYHWNILGDGRTVQTLSVWKIGAHTMRRNTGNLGIAFASEAKCCPTKPLQVERAARLVAEVRHWTGLPISRVVDHRHWAVLDGYPTWRYDIGKLFPVVVKKSLWYSARIRTWQDYELLKGVQ